MSGQLGSVPKNFVYALVDPRTKEWRYVGMTRRGLRRTQEHGFDSSGNGHKKNWVRQLRRAGLRYEVQILEEADDASRIPEMEIEWIAEARKVGVRLLNLTDGGDGGAAGLSPSDETRRKMSISHTGKIRGPHSRASRLKNSRSQGGRQVVVDDAVIFDSQAEVCRVLGLNQSEVSRVLNGKRSLHRHRGFRIAFWEGSC